MLVKHQIHEGVEAEGRQRTDNILCWKDSNNIFPEVELAAILQRSFSIDIGY